MKQRLSLVWRQVMLAGAAIIGAASANGRLNVPVGQVVAPCQPEWRATFGAQPGVNADASIVSMITFDDGAGPALYVAGNIASAGATAVSNVAKWNGARWVAIGTGFDQAVTSLVVFDDGTGPAIYAGGAFTSASGVTVNHVAKWNGSSWGPLGVGTDGRVFGLAVFNDGSGLSLFAGGTFLAAGGSPARDIARWDGNSWHALGTGLGSVPNDYATALAVYDDGTGAALFVGGSFVTAGATTTRRIAKWDGNSWSAVGSGIGVLSNERVSSLAVYDDGGGAALYAGGYYASAGGVVASHIARWDGSAWSALGSGLGTAGASILRVLDDGTGQALYVGGHFVTAGGNVANNVAKWDGTTWSPLGNGLTSASSAFVGALAEFDDGSGPAIYAGGIFQQAGNVGVTNIARWRPVAWTALDCGLNKSVNALAVFDSGHGNALYAGGPFSVAGGVATEKIARWSGTAWSPLGAGIPSTNVLALVYALAGFDDGNGPALYVAGEFDSPTGTNIQKWSGAAWTPLGAGTGGDVYTLSTFDDGNGAALYVGGNFPTAGGLTAWSIAKWNGVMWAPLGVGVTPNSRVRAMAVFDDGNGAALYAGGSFTNAGNNAASRIARWNGTSWAALGSGLDEEVRTLTVFDDGTGPALIAGGSFLNSGAVPCQRIAKWNGSSWSALGGGVNADVRALVSFDDGNGAVLYAGGDFTNAGGVIAKHLARWDGISWSSVGHGTSDPVSALATFNDSTGEALFVGGSFIRAIDSGDSFLAKWGCSATNSGTVYCTAGTTSHGCVPLISATGAASATANSGFTITVTNVEGQRMGLCFYGINGQAASPWSSASTSLLCVKAPLQRMSILNSGGTAGQCDGALDDDWNAYRTGHLTALGQPFGGGETVWAQGWFRDPPGVKTTKLSNGLVFAVAP